MEFSDSKPGGVRRGLHAAHIAWPVTEKVMLIGVPLIFGEVAITMVSREVGREPISISELSVPPALAETGLTPAVAANLPDGHTGRCEALAALGRAADALEALARAASLAAAEGRRSLPHSCAFTPERAPGRRAAHLPPCPGHG